MGPGYNDISLVCKSIGVWNESDIKKSIQRDSLSTDNFLYTWLEDETEFVYKQINNLNRVALWEFDLEDKKEFIPYKYEDTEWKWIYSAPLFNKQMNKCIVKITAYNRFHFPEFKIFSFIQTDDIWLFDAKLYDGSTPDNSLILPTKEFKEQKELIKKRRDSIALTIFPRCDTLNRKTFNCYDSQGQKQGYWKDQTRKVLMTYHERMLNGDDNYGERVAYFLNNEGYYEDDSKTGDWVYYYRTNTWHDRDTLKIVSYLNDGSILERNFNSNYTLNYNTDSTSMSGELYYKIDTIKLDCVDKKCVFKTSLEKEIIRFELYKLDYEMTRLSIGIYDSKIKR